MEQLTAFYNDALTQLKTLTENVLSSATHTQILLTFAALVVLCIVLIIALVVKNRRYNDALDQIDLQIDAVAQARRDAQAAADQIHREERVERTASAGDGAEFERLRKFYAENKGAEGAKSEARRIIREAQDYADDLKGRIDREYIEMIGHAKQESDAIHQMSEDMLARSRDTLRKALDRAKEIVEDARAEAGRVAPVIPDSMGQAVTELDAMDKPPEPEPGADNPSAPHNETDD